MVQERTEINQGAKFYHKYDSSTSKVTRRTINSIDHQKTRNLLVHTTEFYKIEASKIKQHLQAHEQIET